MHADAQGLIVFVIAIFAYIIANTFIGVYHMCIDTIFICFCEDSERNDGSPAKPYFCSERLLVFMHSTHRRKSSAIAEG